jgi:hypothetical protein
LSPLRIGGPFERYSSGSDLSVLRAETLFFVPVAPGKAPWIQVPAPSQGRQDQASRRTGAREGHCQEEGAPWRGCSWVLLDGVTAPKLTLPGSSTRKTRTRASPPSPCGNLPGPTPPGLPGRALSYSVTRGKATAEGIIAGTRVFRAGARVRRELPSWIAPRPIAESRSAYPQPPPVEGRPHDAAEARLRSYPFPMPPGSLPSLKPGDYAGSQFLPEDPEPSRTSALVTGDASQCSPAYRSAQTSSTSLPSTSSLPATEVDRRHHFHQSDLGDYASGPVRPLSTLPPPHTSPPSFAPQAPSYWQNMPGMYASTGQLPRRRKGAEGRIPPS